MSKIDLQIANQLKALKSAEMMNTYPKEMKTLCGTVTVQAPKPGFQTEWPSCSGTSASLGVVGLTIVLLYTMVMIGFVQGPNKRG